MADSLNFWLEETWNDQLALRLRIRSCLEQQVSAFQRVEVYDSQAMGKVLCLGGSIVLTDRDEPIYSEGLTHPALNLHPSPHRILILGGGDGSICREVLRHEPEQVTVVEIDRAVVDVAQRHFPHLTASLTDSRAELVIDDAHNYVARTTERFDCVIIDSHELHQPGSELVHKMAFVTGLHNCLADGGIVIAPLGLPSLHASRCRANRQELAGQFATVDPYTFTTPSFLGQQWAVAWCSNHPRPDLPADPRVDGSACEFWEPITHEALFQIPKPLRKALG